MQKKTKIITIILILTLIIGAISVFFVYKKTEEKEIKLLEEETKLIELINSKYSTYVKTTKETNIYNKEYQVVGKLPINYELTLKEIPITKDTKYFEYQLEENTYYIDYNDIENLENLTIKDNRYKNYIPFNENIKTTTTNLYQNNELKITLNSSIEKPIIKKDDNISYIEFNNELYYVNNNEVEIIPSNNNTSSIETSIPVTVYHFIYPDNETCNEIICHPISQVREHFDYLKENNYFTLNTKEVEYFLDNKINLPENSILITIDDGARAENIIPLLEEYQMNATLFLVTSWYSKDNFQSNYLEIASHTNNLHTPGVCPTGQGSALTCLNKDELVQDLKTSRELLNNTEAFCYPFYEFNNHAITAVKEAGFKTAYIGGQQQVTKKANRFQIPRITIWKSTSLQEYINYVK